ncbi:MAG: MBL fold metallo-hydrolase [Candidatus Zixiibacteriota bacterium]
MDCGLFQGIKPLRLKNWEPPQFDVGTLEHVILTHAHIDHIGYLPRLYRQGFRGTIHCSAPTKRLAEILLEDAAHLQEEDAYFLNKKRATRHSPALPLFTAADAREVLRLFDSVRPGKEIRLTPNIAFEYQLSGHILGACSVIMTLTDGDRTRRILFSGDVGRYDVPMIPDPKPSIDCDYLVIESTYGDRLHDESDPYDSLEMAVRQIVNRGSVLLIPAFAVGRAQQLVHMLKQLELRGAIPSLPIHVDSPMAIDATEIYCDFPGMHRVEVGEGDGSRCLLHGDNITYHRTKASSQSINALSGPRIIISASGMLTGGRILHHLVQRMDNPSNIIALAGFQAEGTRGRDLVEGKRVIRFHGREHEVKAEVISFTGLSGHADYSELMRWVSSIDDSPQTTFVTHGEPGPATAMAKRLQSERGFNTLVPEFGQEVDL